MSLLIVGSMALDTIETPFGKVKEVLGGSATYSSVSASFFTDPRVIAVVGKDFPKENIKFLNSKNIDTRGIEIKDGLTFRWEGRYESDLNRAITLKTELNVFSDFKPVLPAEYRESKNIFLGNIDPELQINVLDQLKSPKLIACDTMNYWIENKLNVLKELLKRIDIFVINDGEAREISKEANLLKAAKKIIKMGPRLLIIKKGEHGCLLFTKENIFSAPAYLLDNVYDPTGAGDTFAGGFMGYISKSPKINKTILRQAIVYGSVMASFAVEDFSLNKLKTIKKRDIEARYKEFEDMTKFC